MASQALAGQSSKSFDSKKIFPSPDFTDKIVVEVVSRKLENYVELIYGTAHPDTTNFPLHQLVFQVEQSEEMVIRYYAAPRGFQDPYDYGISYAEDSVDHPVFTRDYIIRRQDYVADTKLLPLPGVMLARVTAGGTGYVQTTVAVVISGGTGSGATVQAFVSGGAVIGLAVTNPGTYTAAPTLSITGGTGATGVALIQPQSAVLTQEQMLSKTGDERIDSLYVLVRKVYETLPGPAVITTKYDADSDTVYTVTRTKKLLSAITEGGSIVGGTEVTIESEPINATIGWEVTKTFPASAAVDLGSAITIAEDMLPYQFPATIDVLQYVASNGIVAYSKGFVRRVPHLTKVFFVISATKPVLSDYVTPPAPTSMYNFTLSGDPIGEVIYDPVTINYGTVTINYPGSDPDLTTYLASWVNNMMPVLGSIKEASSRFRWRVEVIFVKIILPPLPTFSP